MTNLVSSTGTISTSHYNAFQGYFRLNITPLFLACRLAYKLDFRNTLIASWSSNRSILAWCENLLSIGHELRAKVDKYSLKSMPRYFIIWICDSERENIASICTHSGVIMKKLCVDLQLFVYRIYDSVQKVPQNPQHPPRCLHNGPHSPVSIFNLSSTSAWYNRSITLFPDNINNPLPNLPFPILFHKLNPILATNQILARILVPARSSFTLPKH